MRVLHLSAELGPYARTGGLGDVAAALPQALAAADPDSRVAVIAPLYRAAKRWLGEHQADVVDTGIRVDAPQAGGHPAGRILEHRGVGPARVFFLDLPQLFDREGLYGHGDDVIRFAAFTRAAVRAAGALLGGVPDIVHAHDWHTALAPVYVAARERRRLPGTRTVFTIHNLAYQGVCGKDMAGALDLDWGLFRMDLMEFHDRWNLMKGGIAASGAITTVSPSYAREILTPRFGMQLDGHLRARAWKLVGVLNGIDTDAWDPATDPALPQPFDADHLAPRAASRSALLQRFGLAPTEQPVLAVLSRLVGQKGLDLVADLAPHFAGLGAKLLVLGSGQPELEERFRGLARAMPNAIAAHIGFDDGLARLLMAGSDILLMPSRFEPCGLTQMQAMRYGSVPVVHAVGGLRDTVVDPGDAALMRGEGTGFRFDHPTVQGLAWATERALACARDVEGWTRLRQAGMRHDWSWRPSAQRYLQLYRRLVD